MSTPSHESRYLLDGIADGRFSVRGQGLQHGIIDADNYVQAMLKVADSRQTSKPGLAEKIMEDFDAELIERGNKAVRQSVQEAELSLDISSVSRMLMARQGHGRSA